jgi:hypothetical protein
MKARDLTTKFGPNGPGRAGDHDDLAFECAADLVLLQAHGLAAQQILDGYIADLMRKTVALN